MLATCRDKRGRPGVTRDWNAPVKPGACCSSAQRSERALTRGRHAGAPTPKEMLLEYQEWKASVERERCLHNGLPLPPALGAGGAAPKQLEAAPAEAATPQPAPPAALPPPRKKAVKPITWAHALTKQQLLALLDRQCEAEIWAKIDDASA
jgi:hypothetical protein